MKRLTDWPLVAPALQALGAARFARIRSASPLSGPAQAPSDQAVLRSVGALPTGARRPLVFLIVLALLVALIGGLAYFQFVIKPNLVKSFMAAAFAPKPTTVTVEAAKIEKWPPELTAIGTLRAFQGVAIAPQAAGVVTAIHFESGDDVAAGAPLINIDDSVEQADLANGRAQLTNADETLARQKVLVVKGNTPQSSVDTALATRDSAAASVERTQAIIAQKEIKAPFAGRLGLRNVDLGQYVAVGTSLVTLQQLDPIYADFPAPEEALNTLATGQQVSMTVDAIPGRTFTGKVQAIDARVSAESRNVTARAEFANPDRKLLPGMFANLTVTTGQSADVLALPRTAIVYSLYGDNVFVVTPAPQAGAQPAAADKGGANAATLDKGPGNSLIVERRFVRLGAVRGERVAIVEGVREGERVVTAGQIKLVANMPVTIDERAALPAPAETPRP
jgi:RND family efflux transporter MFP subunit